MTQVGSSTAGNVPETYHYKVVRQFSVMTVVWGVVGMLVGVIIAAQLTFPELNFGVPWFSYGRLRPLHTNAVIFATRQAWPTYAAILCDEVLLSDASAASASSCKGLAHPAV